MKKHILSILALIICSAMLMSLIGCNVLTRDPTEAPTEEPTETPTEEPTETPTEKPTEKPNETQSPEDNDDSANDSIGGDNNEGDASTEDSTTEDSTTEDDSSSNNNNNDNSGNNNVTDDTNNGNGQLTDMSDAKKSELFLKMKTAFEATKAYTGDFYINIVFNGTEKSLNEDGKTELTKAVNSGEATFNNTLAQLISTTIRGYQSSDHSYSMEYIEKHFVQDNKHYLMVYDKGVTNGRQEYEGYDYYSLSDKEWQDTLSSVSVYEAIASALTAAFGNAFDAETYAELTNAYDKVLKEVAEVETESKKVFSTVSTPASIEYDIQLEEASDGTISMTIITSYELTYEKGSTKTVEACSTKNILKAKDGKLISLTVVNDAKEAKNSTEAKTEEELNMVCTYDIAYSFNSDLYNRYTVNMLEGAADEYGTCIDHEISVSINGNAPVDISIFKYYDNYTDFGELLTYELTDAFGFYDMDNYSVAWYTDKNCTSPLDFSAIDSAEDIFNIKELYLKVTTDNNHAVVITTASESINIPEEYLIVFGPPQPYFGGYYFSTTCFNVNSDNIFEINKDSSSEYDQIFTVNGTKIPNESFVDNSYDLTCEGGKIYHVHQDIIYTKASYRIYYILFEN